MNFNGDVNKSVESVPKLSSRNKMNKHLIQKSFQE